jgi:hypothetical protein
VTSSQVVLDDSCVEDFSGPARVVKIEIEVAIDQHEFQLDAR